MDNLEHVIGYEIELQRFAEGGAGGAGGSGAAAAEGGAVAGAQEEAPVYESKRQKQNPLRDVQYGVTAGEEAAPVAEAQADAEEDFESLIKGRYKADFEKRVQGILSERLKNTRQAEEQLRNITPLLDMVGQRYGVQAGDIEGLRKAIEDDNTLYQEEAMDRGMDVETLKQIKQLERENDRLQAQERARAEQTQMQQHFRRLVEQGEQVKAVYPEFDLRAEMQNPKFVALTRPGSEVDVRTAYEVVHRDEILQRGMAYAAQQGAARVAQSVASNRARPTEPGAGGRTAGEVRKDPSKLKKADFDEIRRRVQNGEVISF